MEPADLARIKASIVEMEKRAKVAREEVDKARRAGIDVAELEKRLVDLEANVRRMKAVYVEGK